MDAICERDVDVVALPVACGEMAFRGDALEPIIKQRGPWAVRLELKGAHDKPLAFVATLKKKTLLKESKVLLELFAKTHAAKYDTDIGVLELYQGGRRIDEATLICEVIEDLDAAERHLTRVLEAQIFEAAMRRGADRGCRGAEQAEGEGEDDARERGQVARAAADDADGKRRCDAREEGRRRQGCAR